MSNAIESEALIAKALTYAGIEYDTEVSVICSNPVLNQKGKELKTKTNVDFRVYHQEKQIFIEVTEGSPASDHKQAQKRVIDAASKERGEKIKYVVIDQEKILILAEMCLILEKAVINLDQSLFLVNQQALLRTLYEYLDIK